MSFRCVIVTPEEQVLDQVVTQAIVPAHDGLIGIMTDRAPLLVKLGLGPLRIDLQGGTARTFFIEGGIAQMKDNRLTILTNESIPAEKIDAASAQAEYAEASARVATDAKSSEIREKQLARARALRQIAAH